MNLLYSIRHYFFIMNNHIHIPLGLETKYNPTKYSNNYGIDYIQPSLSVDQTAVENAKQKLDIIENSKNVASARISELVNDCKKTMKTIAALEKELAEYNPVANNNEYNLSPYVLNLIHSDFPIRRTKENIQDEINNNKKLLNQYCKEIDECKKTIDSYADAYNEARINFIMEENKFLRIVVDNPGRYKSGDEIVYDFMLHTITDGDKPY